MCVRRLFPHRGDHTVSSGAALAPTGSRCARIRPMIPVVLVHGGGLDGRCWEPLLPHLEGSMLAVDLPGRGAHPAPLDAVTFADCAESVRCDVDAAGFD